MNGQATGREKQGAHQSPVAKIRGVVCTMRRVKVQGDTVTCDGYAAVGLLGRCSPSLSDTRQR